jgi:hypothetical protein
MSFKIKKDINCNDQKIMNKFNLPIIDILVPPAENGLLGYSNQSNVSNLFISFQGEWIQLLNRLII